MKNFIVVLFLIQFPFFTIAQVTTGGEQGNSVEDSLLTEFNRIIQLYSDSVNAEVDTSEWDLITFKDGFLMYEERMFNTSSTVNIRDIDLHAAEVEEKEGINKPYYIVDLRCKMSPLTSDRAKCVEENFEGEMSSISLISIFFTDRTTAEAFLDILKELRREVYTSY